MRNSCLYLRDNGGQRCGLVIGWYDDEHVSIIGQLRHPDQISLKLWARIPIPLSPHTLTQPSLPCMLDTCYLFID